MAAPSVSGIYEIVNLVNGKRYVGSAISIMTRWRQHRRLLRLGSHHSAPLQNAWRKYGEESFAFRIIRECSRDELIDSEQDEFKRQPPVYNVCKIAGSTLGGRHSQETRAKIAEKKIGLKMPPRSAEHVAKLSAALKGKAKSSEHIAALQSGRSRQKYTDERRAKLAAAMIESYADGRRSRERSTEYREKIAATLRGRRLSAEHRKNVSKAMKGKRRGPYKLDPAKAQARQEAGVGLAQKVNARRRSATPAPQS